MKKGKVSVTITYAVQNKKLYCILAFPSDESHGNKDVKYSTELHITSDWGD